MIDSLTLIIRGKAKTRDIAASRFQRDRKVSLGKMPTSFETRITFKSVKELREYLEQLVEELKQ